MRDFIHVRPAGRSDLSAIAELHNRCRPGAAPKNERDILLSCVERGYLLALRDDAACGVIAWRAENLIAHVLDAFVEGVADSALVERLLVALDERARELRCEVALLVDTDHIRTIADTARNLGYEEWGEGQLPLAWRDAAAELRSDAGVLLIKRLDDKRDRRPL